MTMTTFLLSCGATGYQLLLEVAILIPSLLLEVSYNLLVDIFVYTILQFMCYIGTTVLFRVTGHFYSSCVQFL